MNDRDPGGPPAGPASFGLIAAYTAWLARESTERPGDGDWVALTFPYLDRHNDHFQVYARRHPDGSIRITDGGEAIRDAGRSGRGAGGRDWRAFAERFAARVGPDVGITEDGAIVATATAGDFGETLHGVLTLMMAIDARAGS